MEIKETNQKKKTTKRVIIIIAVVVVLFALIFALYDSPAKYVTTPDGKIYLKNDGEPIIYYTDLFGNAFYQEDGLRVYAETPVYAEQLTPSPSTENSESTSAVNS